MLSRTANGLFWMSRYIERMENIARLMDAGRRMDALPQTEPGKATEWASIVIASGCSTTFTHALENANQANVAEHLTFDKDNPSSILQCVTAARENARAQRSAITTEVWDAINQTWLELRKLDKGLALGRDFADFLEWTKMRGALIRGTIDGTLLRDDGFGFIQLGKHLERVDATARLLDVKYHVLLPKTSDVGGGLDYMQWLQVLRAANAATAYRHLYRRTVDANGVVDLLVRNLVAPRSLAQGMVRISQELRAVGSHTPEQRAVLAEANRLREHVMGSGVDQIMTFGLHEWLTNFIVAANQLAVDISHAYGFDGRAVAVQVQSQSQ